MTTYSSRTTNTTNLGSERKCTVTSGTGAPRDWTNSNPTKTTTVLVDSTDRSQTIVRTEPEVETVHMQTSSGTARILQLATMAKTSWIKP